MRATPGPASRHRLQTCRRERVALPARNPRQREILDRLVEQLVKIELRAQMQEHGAKPNGGAIHEYELARHRDRTSLFERLMYAEGLATAVFGRFHAIGEAAHPIVQQRPVNESRPDVERIDHFPAEPAEAPGLIRMHD